jgi:hypothetical protein
MPIRPTRAVDAVRSSAIPTRTPKHVDILVPQAERVFPADDPDPDRRNRGKGRAAAIMARLTKSFTPW